MVNDSIVLSLCKTEAGEKKGVKLIPPTTES